MKNKQNKRRLMKLSASTLFLATTLFSVIPAGAEESNQKLSMSYLYFSSSESYVSLIQSTQGALDRVSPSFFDVQEDGSLLISNQLTISLVHRLQEQGVKVIPFLSNHWLQEAGEQALENRDALAQEVIDAIETYDLDGVNVDIENVSEMYRDQYSDFVRLLRDQLPEGKEVSVAVAANPNGWETGWHGSYDYSKLAEYADYLMIMTYDENYETGPEGPVASLPWVEESIQYALEQDVPAEKIVLGIPFYGRYWLQGSDSFQGIGISNVMVNQLVEKYDGTVTFDAENGYVLAQFTIPSGDTSTVHLDRTLPSGTYHVYYENDESIRQKVELVHKYGLKGTGSWSLGQEDPSLWDSFDQWLQKDSTSGGASFKDISDHWARNQIEAVQDKGWMNGKGENTFDPSGVLTRAEAAVLFSNLLDLDLSETSNPSFIDISPNHWAISAVEAVYHYGLLKGTSEQTYAPNEPITREQFAVILDRLLAISLTGVEEEGTYPDVSSERWSASSIYKMKDLGVFSGYPNGSFQPEKPITRGETAALLSRISFFLMKEDELLQLGTEGEEVRQLQVYLAHFGYYDSTFSGSYDEETYQAVKQFQQAEGIEVDGIVGSQTVNQIKQALGTL